MESSVESIAHGLDNIPIMAFDGRSQQTSWRSRATRIASGYCSQSRVDPSISVNRNVTVPLGRAGIDFLRDPISHERSEVRQRRTHFLIHLRASVTKVRAYHAGSRLLSRKSFRIR
jgi:hypothetical protein